MTNNEFMKTTISIPQLAIEAVKAINQPVSSKSLFLKMPGKWGRNDYRYLSGRKSPKGKIIQSFVGGVIVHFDAIDILAWCVANG